MLDDLLAELNDLEPSGARSQQQQGRARPQQLPPQTDAHTRHPAYHAHSQSFSPGQQSSKPQQQPQAHSAAQQRPSRTSAPSSKQANDLHSSIDDLLDNLDLDEQHQPPARQHTGSSNSSAAQPPTPKSSTPGSASASGLALSANVRPKCAGVYLGGVAQERGRNGAVIGKLMCCDALRCTKCDLGVIMFPDRAWNDDCDYLFFRNNYPTDIKLAAGQRKEQGTCAYSCQCSWRNVKSGETVRVDAFVGDLNWVCKGHALAAQ